MRTSIGGFPPRLTLDKIHKVMRWHSSGVRFRKRQGNRTSFARSLGLSVHQLQRALKGHLEGLSLSPQQCQDIRRWETRRRRFKKLHLTAAALARSLGISRSTLFLCIEKNGVYRTSVKTDLARDPGPASVESNAALLHAWGRITMEDALESRSEATPTKQNRGAS
jgi:DNA-binding XRE family transcriptional regulator